MGGPTITTMLILIREGFFDADANARDLAEADDSMVASVTTVSAPFRGTGVVYDLGERMDAAPAVRQLSVSIIYLLNLPLTHANFSPLLLLHDSR